MKLSKKQEELLRDKLAGFNASCNLCGNTSFTVIDKVFELREFEGGGLVIGGENSTIPLVVLACNRCGKFMLLSALLLGILDTTEKLVKKDAKKTE